MAQRRGARLEIGTLTDYASPSRILKLFGGDMAAIRTEYSRQRSIIRKRVERMAKAGETHNITFSKFGNVREQLPTVKSLTDAQVLEMLSATAGQLGGGYKTSTLSQIKQSRLDWQRAAKAEAEDMGDTATAEALSKPLTSSQWEKVNRLMGMIRNVTGNSVGSDYVKQEAIKQVVGGRSKESLLTKAARILDALGIDEDSSGNDALERVKSQFTARGTTRVSWAKAHQKRGR